MMRNTPATAPRPLGLLAEGRQSMLMRLAGYGVPSSALRGADDDELRELVHALEDATDEDADCDDCGPAEDPAARRRRDALLLKLARRGFDTAALENCDEEALRAVLDTLQNRRWEDIQGVPDDDLAAVEGYYEKFSEGYKRVGMTRRDVLDGFERERRARPGLTAAEFLSVDERDLPVTERDVEKFVSYLSERGMLRGGRGRLRKYDDAATPADEEERRQQQTQGVTPQTPGTTTPPTQQPAPTPTPAVPATPTPRVPGQQTQQPAVTPSPSAGEQPAEHAGLQRVLEGATQGDGRPRLRYRESDRPALRSRAEKPLSGGKEPPAGQDRRGATATDEFQVGGKAFDFRADKTADGLWTISFSQRPEKGTRGVYKQTPMGDVRDGARVISEIRKRVQALVEDHAPEQLKFDADASEPSRVRLYDALAKRLEAAGYKLRRRVVSAPGEAVAGKLTDRGRRYVEYFFTRVRQPGVAKHSEAARRAADREASVIALFAYAEACGPEAFGRTAAEIDAALGRLSRPAPRPRPVAADEARQLLRGVTLGQLEDARRRLR